jgi:glycosyltransferase involved in cell wall biosynthesis
VAPVIKTGDGFAAGKLDIEERDKIRDRVRTELGIGKEALVVVCVTRFEERKNLELALDAISLVDGEHIYLLLVGSRDEKDPYEEKIRQRSGEAKQKGRVKIIPFSENRKDYLFAADIFLQPSKKEGLSRAAVEGMLSGLPLIATDIPGNRELIVAGENGYLIDPDKPQVLAEMIAFFAQNRGRLSEMGHHSRTRAMRDFDITRYLAIIEEAYLKLSEKAKGEK